MNTPSSTITAATLCGMGMAALWALSEEFYFKPRGLSLSAVVVSSTTTFVSALGGYLKKETVYAEGWKGPG